jgi:glycerophosphoryl diester phosphodiesterase
MAAFDNRRPLIMKRLSLVFVGLCFVAGIVALLPGYEPVLHAFFKTTPPGTVEILAHGGGQGVAPTNTLLALKTAQESGADVLEVDVQLTRDNVLVLHHDDTLDRTTDLSGPVASLTWAQISARDKGGETNVGGMTFSGEATKVARLDDVLPQFPGVRWNIELKTDSAIAAQELCKSIKRAGLVEAVLVPSFHDQAMAEFRRVCPLVATSMAPNEIRTFVIASHLRLARFVKTPAAAVQVPVAAGGFDLTNPRFVAALKARNIKLHYWTINEPGQMDALIKVGADGLLTDFVVRGQEARQRGLHALGPSRP